MPSLASTAALADPASRPFAPPGLRSGGGLGAGALEDEGAVGGVDADGVALDELALEDLQRQFVDQLLLDHPLQRPRAVDRVVAEVAEQGAGIVGEVDRDAALGHP